MPRTYEHIKKWELFNFNEFKKGISKSFIVFFWQLFYIICKIYANFYFHLVINTFLFYYYSLIIIIFFFIF